MKELIKNLSKQANEIDDALFKLVLELYNHMNECDCNNSVEYNFGNVLLLKEYSLRCLNCGGRIQYE